MRTLWCEVYGLVEVWTVENIGLIRHILFRKGIENDSVQYKTDNALSVKCWFKYTQYFIGQYKRITHGKTAP